MNIKELPGAFNAKGFEVGVGRSGKDFNGVDTRRTRPLAQPFVQARELRCGALSQDFDGAIHIVAHPAGDADGARFAVDEVTEADALHAATDEVSSRFHFPETSRAKRGTPRDVKQKLFHAFQVDALGGVDADFFAGVDEGRHLHHQSGLSLRRLLH